MFDHHLIELWIAIPVLAALFISMHVLFIVYYRRKLDKHYMQEQKLMVENLEEGERMMNQIGREVHDNIGQLSNLLRMTLHRIEKTPDKAEQVNLIANAGNLTDLIVSNANNISHSLNSDFIKAKGFCNVIQDDIVHIKASGKIVCDFNLVGEVKSMQPNRELIIYRIAQEAIHNTLKHAQATHLSISLFFHEDKFVMSIQDNGAGFIYDKSDKKGGLGLMNMALRAKLLEGDFQIVTAPRCGCCVNLSIANPYSL